MRTIILGLVCALISSQAFANCGVQWQADVSNFVSAVYQVSETQFQNLDYSSSAVDKDKKSLSIKWNKKKLFITSAQELTEENRAYLRDVLVPNLNEQLEHLELEYTISNSKANVLIYTDAARAQAVGIKNAKTTKGWTAVYSRNRKTSRIGSYKLYFDGKNIAVIDRLGPGTLSGRLIEGLLTASGFPLTSAAVKTRNFREGTVILKPGVASLMACKSLPTRSKPSKTLNLLRKGDRDSTKLVQKALTDAGFKPGPVDGAYGRKTHDALRDYLARKGGTKLKPWITKDVINFMVRVGDLDAKTYDDPLGITADEGRPASTQDLTWRSAGRDECRTFDKQYSFFASVYELNSTKNLSRPFSLELMPKRDWITYNYKSPEISVSLEGDFDVKLKDQVFKTLLPAFSESSILFKFVQESDPSKARVRIIFGTPQDARNAGLPYKSGEPYRWQRRIKGDQTPKYIVWFASSVNKTSSRQLKNVANALAYSLDFRDADSVNTVSPTGKGFSIFTLKPEMAEMLACSYGNYLFKAQSRMRQFRKGSPTDLKRVAEGLLALGYEPGTSALSKGRFSPEFYDSLVAYYDDRKRSSAPIWVTKELVSTINKEVANQ